MQPHSGSQANLAVFFALVRPGDRVLSLDLAAGGHFSHGLRSNLSGRWFEAHHYGVSRETGMIDYDDVEAKALEVQPRILIAGGSSYPRTLDFERLARTANKVGARFVVDMAHFAGLVAGGAHPSPIPHADIVTTTTTKTLRGPRGGVILAREERLEEEAAVRRLPWRSGQPPPASHSREGGLPGRGAAAGIQTLRPPGEEQRREAGRGSG